MELAQKSIKQSALHSVLIASPRLKALFEMLPLRSPLDVLSYIFTAFGNGQPVCSASSTHMAAQTFLIDLPPLETCLLAGEMGCRSYESAVISGMTLNLTSIFLQGFCSFYQEKGHSLSQIFLSLTSLKTKTECILPHAFPQGAKLHIRFGNNLKM